MQALLQKQQQSQRYRSILAGGDGEEKFRDRTIEEKVEHCANLQYVKHEQLFAVSYTSIHKAAVENSLVGIKFFRNRKSKHFTPLETLNVQGQTALHCAAEHGCNDVVLHLLDEGCDVNIRSSYDNTPLMLACKENKVDTIRMLLETGADITLQNKAGMNCIHFAAQSNHSAAIRAIAEAMNYQANIDISHLSERLSDKDAVRLNYEFVPLNHPFYAILKAFNQPSNTKSTPLITAALANSYEAAETLLQFGVHVNAQDNVAETALHKAGRGGLHPIYKLLVSYGGTQSIQNNFHQTANDLLVDNAMY